MWLGLVLIPIVMGLLLFIPAGTVTARGLTSLVPGGSLGNPRVYARHEVRRRHLPPAGHRSTVTPPSTGGTVGLSGLSNAPAQRDLRDSCPCRQARMKKQTDMAPNNVRAEGSGTVDGAFKPY